MQVDRVIFSKNIPRAQGVQLIHKLGKLSSVHFNSGMTNISSSTVKNGISSQLFFTIEMLDEAIRDNKKVSFIYNNYGIDKKLHPVIGSDGNPREYIVEFRADRDQISEIIDWFGKDIMFSELNADEILVSMKTNLEAFRFWALQYGTHVTVTKPAKLVNQLKEDIKDMYQRYMGEKTK